MIDGTMLTRHGILASLVCLVLSMTLATPVNADAETNVLRGDVLALQARVTKLEVLSPQQGEIKALFSEAASLRKDVEQLKVQMQQQKILTDALQTQVIALSGSRPDQPGKPPAPAPGPKPSDNQGLTLRTPFVVKDGAGRIVFKIVAAANGTRAVLGNQDGSRVEIGAGSGGSSVIELFDESSKRLSALVADPKGSYVQVKDNEQSAMLGSLQSEGKGLILRKGEKPFLTLTPDKTGSGALKVFGNTGTAVGALWADDNGGQLVLTGPAGGKTVVGLAVSASGGKVRVFPVGGGTTRAELIANGAIGEVNLFDSDGTNVASLGSTDKKAGHLEMENGSGGIAVQAGATAKGAGFVNTGPFSGGVAGTMGGGMQGASSLLGRLKEK